jgi:trehalose 6-phosphate phosphatase
MAGASAASEAGSALIARIRERRREAGIFLDFDGTLSEIVALPELATVVPSAASELSRLTGEYGLVAVVSGRPAAQVRTLVGVPGVEAFGLYGLEGADEQPAAGSVIADAERAARGVPGAHVERKGASVALHYRLAADPAEAGNRLAAAAAAIARRHGLKVLPGKMVLELAPPEVPGKGAVVLREVRRRGLAGALFAGDDRADVDAFIALDGLSELGVPTAKVAVRSDESPPELLAGADLVVDGPAGLVGLLRTL